MSGGRAGALAAAAGLSLALHLRAVHAGPVWQIYLFKPLTTSLVLLIVLSARGSASRRYRASIALGVCCSLVGDVLLMLPGDRFVAGLVAFLAAHLAYLAAFVEGVGVRLRGWPTAAYLVAGAGVLGLLWERLGALRLPVLLYVGVILLMASQAAGRALRLGTREGRLAAAGAALFVASDAALALERFRGGVPAAAVVVMTTYVAAQLLIALSAAGAASALEPAAA